MKSFKSLANIVADHLAKNGKDWMRSALLSFTKPNLNKGYGYVLYQLSCSGTWSLARNEFKRKPDGMTLQILMCAGLITRTKWCGERAYVYELTNLGLDYMKAARAEGVI